MGKSKLLTRTFAIFTGLLLITFSLIVFVYDYSMNKYAEDEISRSSTGKLEIIRSINELLVDFVGKDALKLSLNAKLNDLYSAIKQTEGEDRINNILLMKDMFQTLEQMVSTSSTVQSVYLYLQDADYVISSNYGAAYTKDFYDKSWLPEYVKANGKAVWLSSRIPFDKEVSPDALSLNNVISYNDYVVTYVFPLSAYTTQVKGAILINLYEDGLSQLINRKTDEGSNIYMVNSKGDVISHTDKSLVGTNIAYQSTMKKIIASPEAEGYFTENVQNERKLISYYKSNVNDWTYVGVNSLDRLTSKANALRFNLSYLFVMLLALELLCSYWILRRLYSPVRRLIQTLKQQRKLSLNENANEVEVLTNAFNEIIKQEEQVFSALEKNKKAMRDQAVRGLLNGAAIESINEELLSISFPQDYFICAAISVDQYKEFQAAFPENHQFYLHAVLLKMIEDMMEQPWSSIGTIMEKNKLGFIINCACDNQAEVDVWLKGVFEFVQHEMKKLTNFTLSVGLGSLQHGSEGIEVSYEDALSSLQRRLVHGRAAIIFYENKLSGIPKNYYPTSKENAVFNQLQLGSLPGVEKAIHDFMDEIRAKTELSADHVYLILNQFAAVTIKHTMELGMNTSDLIGVPDKNIYQQLLDHESLEDIDHWFTSIYRKIVEHANSSKLGSTDYVNRVMAYIEQNFRSDIDLNELSEKMGISYSQLRRRFQGETGENLLAYINKLRIEEAKRLLRQTTIAIADIAISLGYNNEQSLNRFFKKFEGITPGDYRRSR
ncbi:AraC family transcriptional regulator [Paenibacillus koleovorans]|uniref:AraC family transcriptional regulator n=1 Tax=Paenibacillus koleovorans TaxID=121608 RepID=UPI000FD91B57|nr:AraC family transcriptional regulator [Paenibacillus koleovorans]